MILVWSENDSKTFLTHYIKCFYSFIEHISIYYIGYALWRIIVTKVYVYIFWHPKRYQILALTSIPALRYKGVLPRQNNIYSNTVCMNFKSVRFLQAGNLACQKFITWPLKDAYYTKVSVIEYYFHPYIKDTLHNLICIKNIKINPNYRFDTLKDTRSFIFTPTRYDELASLPST